MFHIYIELDRREQALGNRGSRAQLLLGQVPFVVYPEDTPRYLDDAALRRALDSLDAFPKATAELLERGFPGRWKVLDEAPAVWLCSEHASATTTFGLRGDPKCVDIIGSMGTPLDISLAAHEALKRSFFRRSKGADRDGKIGWILDVSADGCQVLPGLRRPRHHPGRVRPAGPTSTAVEPVGAFVVGNSSYRCLVTRATRGWRALAPPNCLS